MSPILVRQLGRVRLQPLDPRLIRHHRLVVVEEPDRRFVVEDGVGLRSSAMRLAALSVCAGLIEELVELGILEAV